MQGGEAESDEGPGDLGRLAAGIAHDLNNLLTAIIGRADLLLLDLPPDSPLREELEGLKKDSRTAARVILRLVEFSGQAPTHRRLTEIAELLEGVDEDVVRRRRGEVRVLIVSEERAGPVYVDPGQMRGVLHALVDNALEAMPERGILLISTATVQVTDSSRDSFPPILDPGGYVRIEVSDNGTGMSREVLSRVFDAYFTTKAAGAGRGLQLAAARQLVRQNRGAIILESEPGRGTEARVFLPVYGAGE